MKYAGTLQVTTPGEREIVIRRAFHAPRHLVWDTLTKPEYIRQWMLGPPGWTMPVCEMNLSVGGVNHLVWRHADGKEMGMRSTNLEVQPPERLVGIEKFDQPWYPGEALITQVLTEGGGETTLTMTLRYESPEARDMVLKAGVEKGLAPNYDKLAEILASLLTVENSGGA